MVKKAGLSRWWDADRARAPVEAVLLTCWMLRAASRRKLLLAAATSRAAATATADEAATCAARLLAASHCLEQADTKEMVAAFTFLPTPASACAAVTAGKG